MLLWDVLVCCMQQAVGSLRKVLVQNERMNEMGDVICAWCHFLGNFSEKVLICFMLLLGCERLCLKDSVIFLCKLIYVYISQFTFLASGVFSFPGRCIFIQCYRKVSTTCNCESYLVKEYGLIRLLC